MGKFACIVGWLLVLAGLAVAVWEFLRDDETGAAHFLPAGQVWYQLDAPSLNLVQAVVERYLWPPLWDPVVLGLLQVPALVLFALPGAVLAILCHRRRPWRRKKRRFK